MKHVDIREVKKFKNNNQVMKPLNTTIWTKNQLLKSDLLCVRLCELCSKNEAKGVRFPNQFIIIGMA